MGSLGVWDNGQAGPCMGRCIAWFGDVVMMSWGWGKCIIGEVGLGHWGRSGLTGEGEVKEGFGGVS